MAPPLTNQVWIYGDADDTLFRLITLGTCCIRSLASPQIAKALLRRKDLLRAVFASAGLFPQ